MSPDKPDLSAFPPTRAEILRIVKDRGTASLSELSEELGLTRENVRQQLKELQQGGWVTAEALDKGSGRGRPATRFALTAAGDHLFPKHYDDLTLTLLETVERRYGSAVLQQAMADLTDANVAKWEERLKGLDLDRRIEALRGIYFEDDPYTEVHKTQGEYRLIEKNCPYLSVAERRPQMCSITVSTLSRLLGYRVVREKRFQDGDHRCVFRVRRDKPIDPESFSFEFEPEPSSEL